MRARGGRTFSVTSRSVETDVVAMPRLSISPASRPTV
jgi:hypothetical protein